MSTTVKKLPVLKTVGQSLLYSLTSIGFLIRVSWLWILVVAGVGLVTWVAIYALSGWVVEQMPNTAPEASTDSGAFETLRSTGSVNPLMRILQGGLWATIAILVVALCSIAVQWHRRFLTGELPGWFTLGFGRRTLSYIGYAVAIGLVSGLAMAVVHVMIDVLTPAINSREATERASIGILAVIALMIFARLHLVLPGTAVGDQRISLRYSFDQTSGNSLRIAGGFMLILLLHAIPGAILYFTLPVSHGSVGVALTTFYAPLAMHLVLGSVILSYMSHCYGFFVPPPGQDDLA